MKQHVIDLVAAIEAYINNRISGDELEKVASKIMAADDYETMPDDFCEHVELLDMWEVNQITPKDLDETKEFFIKWLKDARVG